LLDNSSNLDDLSPEYKHKHEFKL